MRDGIHLILIQFFGRSVFWLLLLSGAHRLNGLIMLLGALHVWCKVYFQRFFFCCTWVHVVLLTEDKQVVIIYYLQPVNIKQSFYGCFSTSLYLSAPSLCFSADLCVSALSICSSAVLHQCVFLYVSVYVSVLSLFVSLYLCLVFLC